ncbi:MAG TPA: hypothetical protein DCX53_00390 [Anaerolineae bacterium]|nr:hypothetical protein [Anaerolineae bacterium]
MPKIVFRGKTYNSVFEMPNELREAYQVEKRRGPAGNNASKPLTDFVEMSDEIRDMYERALGTVKDKSVSSQPLSELPTTEDIYRQSAPSHMKNLPSDESAFRPSPSPVPPAHPAIEEDNGPRRLVLTIIGVMILAGAAFFVLQYMN